MRRDYSSLRQGLVGAWCPSIGATGYALIDRSGRGNHGTSTSGMSWSAIQGGSALSGNGTSGISRISSRSDLRITSGTITGWFRIGAVTAASAIFATYSQNSSVAGITLGTGINTTAASVNRLSVVVGNNTGSSTANYAVWASAATVLDSLLHSFSCVILPSGAVTFWVDGVATATTLTLGTQLSPAYAATSLVGIGAEQNGVSTSKYWPGLLDDIRVYNRILAPQEIRLLASRRGVGLTATRQRRTSASSRRLYQKVAGTWKETLPLVNAGGAWKEAAVYQNVGGTWKN
jgi:hypothetical protein